ncbi:MAG: flagellar hook-associated protein FlgK [Planctomycetes bacterium]|nr:flagellar hook-associated protein FlgK [Planctomycetota bacterium]
MASVSLNVGLKALLTAQSALDTVGHNVSNANTPGYSRQSLQISASPSIFVRGIAIGNGVDANVVLRTADDLLTRRLVQQTASIQQLETRVNGMSQVEALIGEPGDRGLNALMQNFFSSLSSLAASPEDVVLRTGLVQSTQSLTGRFQDLASSLATVRSDSARQVEAQVDRVNTLSQQVASLNREIGGFEGTGVPANDLRDQRDEALKKLGELLNINYTENPGGTVTVLASGAVLVGSTRAYEMSAAVKNDGSVTVHVEGNPNAVGVRGGTIGGLVTLSQDFIPSLRERFNTLAKNMILELNRSHSTGIPASGAFQAITGAYSIQDQDNDGEIEDELLSSSGLPFDVQDGALYLNVVDDSDGSFTTKRIDIDHDVTTVGDLLGAINATPHVSAALDSFGRIQIASDDGYRFDFSRRVNPRPDTSGTFGSGAASLGATADGPYNLSNGDTLTVNGPSGAFTVTFSSADFADISQASANEIADAINADPSVSGSGMRAVGSGGKVFLQSLATGTTANFTVSGGSALTALGWSAGLSATGQDHEVDVRAGGEYTGSTNARYTLAPTTDGTIGTTPGLTVGVFDDSGLQVGTLDVGAGYQPGTELDLPNGLKVSFGFGQISATNQDQVTIEALADSDTADVLVALGVNSFLTGTDASDIALRRDIESDSDLLASSMTGAEGDNTILNEMLSTQRAALGGLGDKNLGEYYGDVVGNVGFDIDVARNAQEVEQFLFDSLSERRQQVAGVNVDEELVNMIQFQQAYGAAAQFIQTVNRVQDDLLSIL